MVQKVYVLAAKSEDFNPLDPHGRKKETIPASSCPLGPVPSLLHTYYHTHVRIHICTHTFTCIHKYIQYATYAYKDMCVWAHQTKKVNKCLFKIEINTSLKNFDIAEVLVPGSL